jgi:hypothetical protein
MVNIMKNKILYLPIFILTLITVAAGAVLSATTVSAEATDTRPINVTVGASCGFDSEIGYTSSLTLIAGNSANTESDTAKTTYTISCVGFDGFSIQAVGFSPNATSAGEGVDGNTDLYSTVGVIPTNTPGPNSYWAFRVSSATSSTSYSIPGTFANYSAIPSTPTSIINYAAAAALNDTIVGSFRTDYNVYTNISQPAGTYTGAVKYTVVTES